MSSELEPLCPTPSPSLALTATALMPERPSQVLALAEVIPPPLERRARPLVDLTLVVDRSSSMRGPRLAAAVEAVRLAAARLGPADLLTVVVFDRDAQLLVPPAPVYPMVARETAPQLTALGVGHGTNLEAGLRLALGTASAGGLPGAARTLVVISDGYASVGADDAAGLAPLAREAADRGLAVHAVGVGEKFDEALLSALAVAGGGRFHYARHDHDVVQAVEALVDGEANLLCDRCELRLSLGAAVTRYEVVHRVPSRLRDRVLGVTLGRLHLGQPRPVLLKLDLDPAADEPVVARAAWHRLGQGGGPGETGLLTAPLVVAADDARAAAAARIGAAWMPLRVARALESIWKLGLSTSPEELRQGVTAAVQYALDAPPEFQASEEARAAVEYLLRLADVITSGGQLTAHLAREISQHTTGIFTVGLASPPRGGGGWGNWGGSRGPRLPGLTGW